MTVDTSNEAVERAIRSLSIFGPTHEGDIIRALAARVAELEGERDALAVVDGVPMTGPESERRADAARAALAKAEAGLIDALGFAEPAAKPQGE